MYSRIGYVEGRVVALGVIVGHLECCFGPDIKIFE
jgi:hypothetical protein